MSSMQVDINILLVETNLTIIIVTHRFPTDVCIAPICVIGTVIE